MVCTIAGLPHDVISSDMELVSSQDITSDLSFSHPHHPWHDNDTTWVFDNGPQGANSRALALTIDAEDGSAALVAASELGFSSPIPSRAYRLPYGNVFVTCASQQTFMEFSPLSPEIPIWSLTLSCPNAADRPPPLIRGMPLEGL